MSEMGEPPILHRVVMARPWDAAPQRATRRAAVLILASAMAASVLLVGGWRQGGAADEGVLAPAAQMEALCGGPCPLSSGWAGGGGVSTSSYWVPGSWVWKSKPAAAARMVTRYHQKRWGIKGHDDYVADVYAKRWGCLLSPLASSLSPRLCVSLPVSVVRGFRRQ